MRDDVTLDDLDPPAWGPPDYDSHLVRTCHELRTRPVSQFTPEDFRIMIGQRIALSHLMPRAIVMLERNALAEGDFGPGDLLRTVLTCPDPGYWESHPDQTHQLREIIEGIQTDDEDVLVAIESFISAHG